ncbi:MAG: hypothetical protein HY824_12415 [Acidobacteria bacterium]|nr:hypothetical protein [Acidobacteriota bacterium]
MKRQWIPAVLLLAGLGAGAPAAAQRVVLPGPAGLPPEVVSLACAPTLTFEPPPMPLRITGSQNASVRRLLAPGDLLTINAGTDNGLDVGQQYYTRRAVPREKRAVGRDNPAVIQTTGWIRIYAVDRTMSLATVVHPCDSLELNDYLEPFALPALPPASPDRPAAQRGNYGRVMIGNDNRRSFGKGDYLVVDRGSDHGVAPGAQFVLYRDQLTPGNFLFEIGEAVAVTVSPEASTLQVTLSRDGILVGDYVAMRR